MFFLKRKDVEQYAKPVSKEFTVKGRVQSMSLRESPVGPGRQSCIIELYSEEPVMVNGETEHRFSLHLSNYSVDPRYNRDRMKFWLCYGYEEAVRLGGDGEPYVPQIDEESCRYFVGRTLPFHCQVVQLRDGREVVELDYIEAG